MSEAKKNVQAEDKKEKKELTDEVMEQISGGARIATPVKIK